MFKGRKDQRKEGNEKGKFCSFRFQIMHVSFLRLYKEDLFRLNSLNFEALKGNKAGRFSIRVNNQYRIEFTIEENSEESVLTICNIVELSDHYD